MRVGRNPLTEDQVRETADWIARQQRPDGEIPWWRDGAKADPWDHAQATMGLTVAGRHGEAEKALRFLAETQHTDGGWVLERRDGEVVDPTRETNHAAYFATALWHRHLACGDLAFLAEMWPAVEKSIDFVVDMQAGNGTIHWAMNKYGEPFEAPLLTGSASTHGSIVCALRIAQALGHERPRWEDAREKLGEAVRAGFGLYVHERLPEIPGRYSMDWYYPVLGGAIRGAEARKVLTHKGMNETFITEGVGCRCVFDNPWYTVAETCELVLALDACGLTSRASQIFSWMRPYRAEDGSYQTGKTHPENVFWPTEMNAWTGATVLLAADALGGQSATSRFFHSLAGDDLVRADRGDDEAGRPFRVS